MIMEKELNQLETEFKQCQMGIVEERARFVSFCIEHMPGLRICQQKMW